MYLEQMINPWGGARQRLPDHNIRPTNLAAMFANRTYTTGSSTGLYFAMHSKLTNYNGTSIVAETNSPYSAAGATSLGTVYQYVPGCILTPIPFTSALGDTTINNLPWNDDYGAELAVSNQFVAASRPLSVAMRFRVVGLPSGMFMAPGRLYVAQVRYNAIDLPKTEQDFVTLERLNQASHVSLDSVRASGSKTFFVVPDGADKFRLSSSFALAPGVFTLGDFVSATATNVSVRLFPAVTPHAYGSTGLVDPTRAIMPYISTPVYVSNVTPGGGGVTSDGITDPADALSADETYFLVAALFGSAAGTVLEVDYAVVTETVPTPSAPPGMETAIQMSSSPAMDAIFSAATMVAATRGVMFQCPGDKTVTAGPMATAESKRFSGSAARQLVRAAGRPVPRAEGFFDFDWIKSATFGKKGNGLSWDFTGK
jgi:hypothetical protein